MLSFSVSLRYILGGSEHCKEVKTKDTKRAISRKNDNDRHPVHEISCSMNL